MRKIIPESKDMTVNYFDTLITTKILRASGFIQSQAKAFYRDFPLGAALESRDA